MLGTRSAVEGFPTDKITNQAVVLMLATPGSPAAVAGLEAGDSVVAVESSVASLSVASSSVTVAAIRDVISGANSTVTFTVEKASTKTNNGNKAKGGAYKIYEVTPKDGVVPGKKAIGISMQEVGTVSLGFFESFIYGAKSTWNLLQNVAVGLFDFIVKIFTSDSGAKAALNSVSGPVGIASIVGSSARQGFSALLVITAIISANLAVLNLVPFPALDGGRLLVVAIEGTIRRRLNPKIVGWVNAIGFLLLIGLMIVVTFKDIFALF
jgi:regulator of sigma E protease